MIPNYAKPQSFVRQNLQVIEEGFLAARNAFVYGPHYRLSRFANAEESGSIVGTPYAGGTTVIDLTVTNQYNEVVETLDEDFVTVYAEGLQFEYLSGYGAGYDDEVFIKSLSEPNVLIAKENGNPSPFPPVGPNMRQIREGDEIRITFDGETRNLKVLRTVTDISGVIEIVLDGAATIKHITDNWSVPDQESGVLDVYEVWSGEVTSGVTVNGDEVSVTAISIEGVPAESNAGELYVSARFLQKGSVDEPVVRITSFAQIVSNFGKIDPDNTLAFGLSRALTASGGKVVYGARVRSDDVTGYNEVLRKSEQNRNLNYHAPLTYAMNVQQSVKAHVERMSNWDVKRWRRAYVSTAPQDSIEVLPVSAGVEMQGDAFGNVVITSGSADFVELEISPGDILVASGVEYEVVLVVGSDTLVVAGSAATINGAVSINKGNTGTNQSRYVASRSQQLNSRYVSNLFVDGGTAETEEGTVVIEPFYLAAEYAGLVSAVLPHQPVTRVQMESISAAPLMYTKYTEEDLDYMASRGVLLITQDSGDTPVYIRHQLTTDVSHGPLYYEDSAGRNVDDLSFAADGITEGYVGRYNATEDLVRIIRNRLIEEFSMRARSDRLSGVGPQILNFSPSDIEVEIDPNLRNRINVKITVSIPLPLNSIVVDIFAQVEFSTLEDEQV